MTWQRGKEGMGGPHRQHRHRPHHLCHPAADFGAPDADPDRLHQRAIGVVLVFQRSQGHQGDGPREIEEGPAADIRHNRAGGQGPR